MSNTYKHKDKGKFNNGLLDKIPQDLENMWDRSNNDCGEFRASKKQIKEKIAEKEMKEEIVGLTTEYNITEEIKSLIKSIPNDSELGRAVRELFS